jgi:tRNA (guanine37-N1)-methyltransferase
LKAFTFGVLTLFPEMFSAVKDYGVVGRAFREGQCRLVCENPRDFAKDAHRTVDDTPYGGGPGMVMKPEPLWSALQNLRQKAAFETAKVVYLSPQGRPVKQIMIDDWSEQSSIIFLAGRYEGVDERFLELAVDEEVCVGDCVVSGGELPAMILIDAIARQLTGVLGDPESARQDSFAAGRLDWPHYTRPIEFQGRPVPAILRSGNHQEIARWRHARAVKRTVVWRPDLLEQHPLNEAEEKLLSQYGDD